MTIAPHRPAIRNVRRANRMFDFMVFTPASIGFPSADSTAFARASEYYWGFILKLYIKLPGETMRNRCWVALLLSLTSFAVAQNTIIERLRVDATDAPRN